MAVPRLLVVITMAGHLRMKDIRQFPAMTAVRGVAAWWVVLYHIHVEAAGLFGRPLLGLVSCGYLAVDLFFVLSGFVVALNYAHLFRNLEAGNCLVFYGLRLARIYPLHGFMLVMFLANPLAITLLSTQNEIGDRYGLGYFLLSIALMQNWGFTDIIAWNIPAWSISTEWATYLAFPATAWVGIRVLRTATEAAAAALVLMLTLAIAFAAMSAMSLGDRIPHLGILRCLLEFVMGICLLRLWQVRGDAPVWEGNAAALTAALLAVVHVVWSVPDYVVFPVAFFLLIHALTNERTIPARLLASRVLGWAGTVSYSTYMVHYFVKDWVRFLLLDNGVPLAVVVACYLGATLAASAVLYHWMEVPGRAAFRAVLAAGRRVSSPSRLPEE